MRAGRRAGAATRECPKCGFEAVGGGECARCGLVFARWRPRDSAAPAAAEVAHEAAPSHAPVAERAEALPRTAARLAVDRAGWLSLGGGFVAAGLALQIPLAQAALGGLATLVHEMGHAAFGWLFGYPSVPAFDFAYGGGVTLHQERALLLCLAIAAGGVYGVWTLRDRPPSRDLAIGWLVVWAALALTRGHEAAILAMGHGGELAFATLALHRALSGHGCRLEAERPLYGLAGGFLVLSGMTFAWRLSTSAFHRAAYAGAKGGGHWMDLSRLANEHLHVSLETVATAFGIACLAPPAIALWLQRGQRARGRAERRALRIS